MARISGLTIACTTALGVKIRCMVKGSISTMMESDTMANTKTIRRKASAFTTGLMVVSMMGGGTKADNMVLDFTLILRRVQSNMVFGSMASVLSGLHKMKSTTSIRVLSLTFKTLKK